MSDHSNTPSSRKLLHISLYSFAVITSLAVIIVSYALWPGYLLQYPGAVPFYAEHVGSVADIILNQAAGYPRGIKISHNIPTDVFHYLVYSGTNLDPYRSWLLADFLILCFGLWGGARLFSFFGINSLIALALSTTYLLSPFVQGQYLSQYPHSISFIIMPLLLWLELIIIDKFSKCSPKKYWFPLLLLCWCSLKAFTLLLNGYVFMIGNLAISCYLAGLIFQIKTRRLAIWAGFIIANLAGFLSYKKYSLSGGDFAVMPIDFFRGQGIDLITMLQPPKGLWLSDAFGWFAERSALAFYGDGSNISYNYLGYTCFIALLLFVFLKFKKNWASKSMITAGVLAFILAIGPSIKFNDHLEGEMKGPPTFQNYMMPAEAATLSLHTDPLYLKIPGLKNMRAVYRWHALSILVVMMVVGLVSQHFLNQKRYLFSCLLLAGSLAELFPNIPHNLNRAKISYQQNQQYYQEVLVPLKKQITPGEKVLFLSPENDFLIMGISRFIDAKFYNGHGDKELAVVKTFWPEEISKIIESGDNFAANLKDAFDQQHLNQLIIPHFSMRNNYYTWPPAGDPISKCAEYAIEQDGFVCTASKWFDRISKKTGSVKSPILE